MTRTIGIALVTAGAVLLLVALSPLTSRGGDAGTTINRGSEEPRGHGWLYVNGFNVPAGETDCDLATVWQNAQMLLGPPVGSYSFSERTQPFRYYVLVCAPNQRVEVENTGLLDLVARGRQPVPNAEPATVVQDHILSAMERGVDPGVWFGAVVGSPRCSNGICSQWLEKAILSWKADASSGEEVTHESLGCRRSPPCLAAMSANADDHGSVNPLMAGAAALALLVGAAVLVRGRQSASFEWSA